MTIRRTPLRSAAILHGSNTSRYVISNLPSFPGHVYGLKGGFSSAAADRDDVPQNSGYRRKPVSKKERKDNVISFVNKYKEMNAGKFPSVTLAQKEVGGGYYTIRKIIQELVHNSKYPEVVEDSGGQVQASPSDAPSSITNTNLPSEAIASSQMAKDRRRDKNLGECQLTVDSAAKPVMTHNVEFMADIVPGCETSAVADLRKDLADIKLVSVDERLERDRSSEEYRTDQMDAGMAHNLTNESVLGPTSSQKLVDRNINGDFEKMASDRWIPGDNEKYFQEKNPLRASTSDQQVSDEENVPGVKLKQCDLEVPTGSNPPFEMGNQSQSMRDMSAIKKKNEEVESASKSTRLVEKTDHDEDKKSSILGTLKSIAGNLFGLWKKL